VPEILRWFKRHSVSVRTARRATVEGDDCNGCQVTRTDLHRLLGQRWALPVLEALATGPMRFNELKRACGCGAPALAKTMRELTREDLLVGAMRTFDGFPCFGVTSAGRQVLAWSRLLPLKVSSTQPLEKT
jgi:hypothetical protein